MRTDKTNYYYSNTLIHCYRNSLATLLQQCTNTQTALLHYIRTLTTLLYYLHTLTTFITQCTNTLTAVLQVSYECLYLFRIFTRLTLRGQKED